FITESSGCLVLMQPQSLATAIDPQRNRRMENDTNLVGKLDRLHAEFGIAAQYRDYFDSIGVARNVFAHNLGIVRERDCRGAQAFTLKWRGWDMVFGSHVVSGPFSTPLEVEQATTVTIRPVERTRTFIPGSLITISPHDLSEICMNFLNQAQEIEKSTADYGRRKGLHVEEALIDPSQSPP